jgi:hypothetical protein
VEHWNSYAGIRQDLWGWIDVLAIRGDQTLAVQSTTGLQWPAHVKKICDSEISEAVFDWLQGKSRRAVLVAWRKLLVKRGGKAMRWTPRVGDILINDGKLIVMERHG